MKSYNLQWHLVLLNFLTCGLEICIAAGVTYVPPVLLEAGVEEQYMTMVLGIGPVLGLVFIPLIGSASDNCSCSYGRRRPFIWLLSLGVLLSLFIIPHADLLASYFSFGGSSLQVAFLILGVGLLDFCVQVCFTPLEALLSDLYHDADDYGQAFAMYSFMISVGGCIGYLLTAVNWNDSYISFYLGGQEECLFSLLTIIFVISVIITMRVSEELAYPLESVVEPKLSEMSRSAMRCCYFTNCKLRFLKSGPLFCLLRACWSMTPAIYRSYCRIPKVMKQLCISQLCSWMAVMSFMLFYTDFVGEGLYKGIPSAAPGTESRLLYDEGVRMGSLGLFLQCATSTFFSIIMNKLVKYFGSRRIYLASMVTFTLSALVICFSKSVVIVTVMSSLTGFANATLQTLPYTLICLYHKEKEIFMQMTIAKHAQKNGITITRESAYLAHNHYNEKGLLSFDTGAPYAAYYPAHYSKPQDQSFSIPNGFSSSEVNGWTSNNENTDYEKRGIGLDFAILDSTFLLSQVFPSLFMGMIVQFTESVIAYTASSTVFGFIAIYLATKVVFEKRDL
uniref:Solute carrier family 45 member 3 n=1 Tax=Latimeria chalumnae TaxID=7897 RepID=H3BF76_LATCH